MPVRPRSKHKQTSAMSVLFGGRAGTAFCDEGWLSEPHVHHGSLRRLGAWTHLDEFADFRRWPKEAGVSLTATMASSKIYRKLAVDPKQAAQLFGVGATLTFNGVHAWHAKLGRQLDAMAVELGLLPRMCHCNVYVSPKGGGVPKHFDSHHVVVVHLVGTKRWTIAPNRSVVHPIDNHVASRAPGPRLARHATGTISRAMPRTSRVFEMRPGSVLFLPAGYWHRTQSEEHTLSVTFGMRTMRWVDIVRDAIASRLERMPEWREQAWGAAGNTRQRGIAQGRLAALLERTAIDLGRLSAETLLDETFPRARARTARKR